MSLDSSTRASLLARLSHNPADAEAWAKFVNRYGRAIFSWCRRRGLQQEDAEDVSQGLLFKLVTRMRTFVYDRAKGKYRALLKTLVEHEVYDFLEQRRRAAVGAGGSEELECLLNAEARESLAHGVMDQFDLELLEIAKERVRLRVNQATWEAYRLLAEEELDPPEVAIRVNMRVGQTYVAKSRVLEMLREEVQRLEESGSEGKP